MPKAVVRALPAEGCILAVVRSSWIMQNLPQIVRDRLRAKTAAGDHPDANVLTAFAEKLLPESERSVVFEHLARCGNCRDVLALALPQPEPAAVTVPVRSGWLTWPALRWGLAAAGIVAIVSFGVVQYQRQQPASVAQNARAPESAVTQPVQTPAPPVTDESRSETQLENRTKSQPVPLTPNGGSDKIASRTMAGKDSLNVRSPQAPPMRIPQPSSRPMGAPFLLGPQRMGPNMPQQWQQQTRRMQALPSPTVADSKQQARGIGGSAGSGASAAAATRVVEVETGGSEIAAAQTQEPGNQIQSDLQTLSRAKPATTAQTATAAPNPSSTPQIQAATAMSSTRWTINSSGGLQRSFDQGSTWHDVDINAAPATSANLAAMPPAGVPVAKTNFAETAQALKKSTKAVAAPPIFRAVAANGNEVWAGGSAGGLYHSADSGDSWTRIIPASGGIALTGDVVAISFGDTLHGNVSTSTAETWTTNDGGQTWLRQ